MQCVGKYVCAASFYTLSICKTHIKHHVFTIVLRHTLLQTLKESSRGKETTRLGTGWAWVGVERGKLGQRRGKHKGKATREERETGGGEGKTLEGNTIIALNTSRTAQVLRRNSHLIPDGRLLVKRHRLLLLVALFVIVLALLLLVLLFLLVLLVILLVLVLCGM